MHFVKSYIYGAFLGWKELEAHANFRACGTVAFSKIASNFHMIFNGISKIILNCRWSFKKNSNNSCFLSKKKSDLQWPPGAVGPWLAGACTAGEAEEHWQAPVHVLAPELEAMEQQRADGMGRG